MRVLVIGAGGVGTAVAKTAAKWGLFERVVVADHDVARAQRAVAGAGRPLRRLPAGRQQRDARSPSLIESEKDRRRAQCRSTPGS